MWACVLAFGGKQLPTVIWLTETLLFLFFLNFHFFFFFFEWDHLTRWSKILQRKSVLPGFKWPAWSYMTRPLNLVSASIFPNYRAWYKCLQTRSLFWEVIAENQSEETRDSNVEKRKLSQDAGNLCEQLKVTGPLCLERMGEVLLTGSHPLLLKGCSRGRYLGNYRFAQEHTEQSVSHKHPCSMVCCVALGSQG